MQTLEFARARSKRTFSIPRMFAEWFPVPKILSPHSAGVDISDTSIKWIALDMSSVKKRVSVWGEAPLQPGIVVNGVVENVEALAEALRQVKKSLGGIAHAHASLPEESAYVFSMHVPDKAHRQDVLNVIEFELGDRVPIPPAEAVYDFDVIRSHGDTGQEIGVSVFPRRLSENYVEAFKMAGIELLSLEVEARSIARAVSGRDSAAITLLVDFGRARTGFALLEYGVPIFTSTVAVGGDTMTKVLMEKASLTPEAAQEFKNNEGLASTADSKSPGLESLLGTAGALADEIARHFHYWDTRRNEHGERVTPVECVFLVGGSANLKGLPDYIAGRVQASVVRPNVWRNVCLFDEYIPAMDKRVSLQYATAIGLALRGA